MPPLRHTVIYLGLGVVCTHFVPVCLIMRLYRLEGQDESEQLVQSIGTDDSKKKSNLTGPPSDMNIW